MKQWIKFFPGRYQVEMSLEEPEEEEALWGSDAGVARFGRVGLTGRSELCAGGIFGSLWRRWRWCHWRRLLTRVDGLRATRAHINALELEVQVLEAVNVAADRPRVALARRLGGGTFCFSTRRNLVGGLEFALVELVRDTREPRADVAREHAQHVQEKGDVEPAIELHPQRDRRPARPIRTQWLLLMRRGGGRIVHMAGWLHGWRLETVAGDNRLGSHADARRRLWRDCLTLFLEPSLKICKRILGNS